MASKSSSKKGVVKKESAKKESDRRIFRRVPVNIWVREEKGDYYFLYKATDISEGGIFLEKKIESPSCKDRSILKFTLPKSTRLICVQSDIIFSNTTTTQPRAGSGLKFVNLSTQDKKLITKYIQQN